jgi:alanine racemase
VGPDKRLEGGVLRANVAAFAALGAPVAAVVKNDGYGWGARRLARELDAVVESYMVADLDELTALRPATAKPVRLLSDAPAGMLGRVLDLGGIANVSTRSSLAEAAAEAGRRGGLTVRVGVMDAAGWYAIAAPEVPSFAAAFAEAGLAVELWTHISSAGRTDAILDGFLVAQRAFEAAGVRVASVDVAATSAASRRLAFDRLRVGAGLFGSRLGAPVEAACALRVDAPIVRKIGPGEWAWAGYGDTPIPPNRTAVVLRCGYGDGLPRQFSGSADILSVGMQYTVRLMSEDRDPRELIGESDDVDALAARAGISPHELVLGLAPR